MPRLAEWKYTALASDTAPDGRHNPASLVRLLEWYTRPMPAVPPTVGSGTPNYWSVHDLHGVIWEWVADFQTMLVTGESRGDSDVERNLFCGAGVTGLPRRHGWIMPLSCATPIAAACGATIWGAI